MCITCRQPDSQINILIKHTFMVKVLFCNDGRKQKVQITVFKDVSTFNLLEINELHKNCCMPCLNYFNSISIKMGKLKYHTYSHRRDVYFNDKLLFIYYLVFLYMYIFIATISCLIFWNRRAGGAENSFQSIKTKLVIQMIIKRSL